MRILCVALAAVLVVASALDSFQEEDSLEFDASMPNPSWARLVASSRHLKLADGDDNNCTGIFSCQDCNTARICRPTNGGSFSLVETIKCTNDRPYCDPSSGSCVAEEPEGCAVKDSFVCIDNGKFPDPTCTKFHACMGYESMTFECAVKGENYNAKTQSCDADAPCGTFDCNGNEGRKVAHSQYSNFFAYCRNDNGPLVIGNCPVNYQLNVTSQICEPACLSDGIVPDVFDCHHFFKCTKIYIRKDLSYMHRERLQCPASQAYSRKDFLCVDENSVPECQK